MALHGGIRLIRDRELREERQERLSQQRAARRLKTWDYIRRTDPRLWRNIVRAHQRRNGEGG